MIDPGLWVRRSSPWGQAGIVGLVPRQNALVSFFDVTQFERVVVRILFLTSNAKEDIIRGDETAGRLQ